MGIARKIRRALRGRVPLRAAALEAGRRAFVAVRLRSARAASRNGKGSGEPERVRLAPEFARLSGAELLEHFRTRATPRLFEGAEAARDYLAPKREGLEAEAREVSAHRWPLLGYGVREFGARVDWLREPASGVRWPLGFHGDVPLVRGDGSDVRVLWELNRLGHLLTLARAYVAGGGEDLAEEFFAQVESWTEQNPSGQGPNWACAMEVALRAVNLLAAFQLFKDSPLLDEQRLARLLALFDAHGRHIRRNLEYSYIATSNHYLSDVAGLLWLGLLLPELDAAAPWREFAFKELPRELDRQVLPDGSDWEASTNYHRFVTEVFLYSFLLCRENGLDVDKRVWAKVLGMLEYMRAYLRPDGRAPLVGDADGGQFLPLVKRDADDHAYLLAVGAALFREPRFKVSDEAPEEVFWLLGARGLAAYGSIETGGASVSHSEVFKDAGTCVLREGDLYLLLNASGTGLGGRGAHGHNDALSIEVSACGTCFIKDPGTFVYTSDPRARHRFRSTAYHSTVEVDGVEQNTIIESAPFHLGDEARPRVTWFSPEEEHDTAIAEHRGYTRLEAGPVLHVRIVNFHRRERFWLIEDSLAGEGTHDFRFVFHVAPGREVKATGSSVEILDAAKGARLVVAPLEELENVAVEPRGSSRDYGAQEESAAAVWQTRAAVPLRVRWLLLPICAGEDAGARLELITRLRAESKA